MTRGLLLAGLLVLGACSSPPPPEPPPAPRCYHCAEVLDEPAVDTCDACTAEAILRPDEAVAARRRAEAALAERFHLRLPRGVRASLTLLELDDLRSLAGEGGQHLLAFTEVEELLRGGEPVDLGFRIYLARGTPASWAAGILAHELFHVWQTLQGGGPSQADAFREGAAQYVQHEVLEQLGATKWARRVAHDPDPVYGDGLRRFRAVVLAEGESRALELAGREHDFPSGY